MNQTKTAALWIKLPWLKTLLDFYDIFQLLDISVPLLSPPPFLRHSPLF